MRIDGAAFHDAKDAHAHNSREASPCERERRIEALLLRIDHIIAWRQDVRKTLQHKWTAERNGSSRGAHGHRRTTQEIFI